mmetsp:Transcript_38093/g.91452  ORF Transcript_38093/g.91452 Transcript_38093/m.91452 type:complete len:227 (+) Transcript_38093:2897-3577(+)
MAALDARVAHGQGKNPIRHHRRSGPGHSQPGTPGSSPPLALAVRSSESKSTSCFRRKPVDEGPTRSAGEPFDRGGYYTLLPREHHVVVQGAALAVFAPEHLPPKPRRWIQRHLQLLLSDAHRSKSRDRRARDGRQVQTRRGLLASARHPAGVGEPVELAHGPWAQLGNQHHEAVLAGLSEERHVRTGEGRLVRDIGNCTKQPRPIHRSVVVHASAIPLPLRQSKRV